MAQSAPPQEPTAAESSKKETLSSAFLRAIGFQEYELRSVAEAMPEGKYAYRPAEGKFGPSPAKSKKELLIYLRDPFAAIRNR